MRQQLDSGSDDIKELIKENNKLVKETLEVVKKTRRSLRVMQLAGTLKFLIVLIPLVGALIFLPPLLSGFNKQFESMTGGAGIFDVLRSLPKIISGEAAKGRLPSFPKNIDPNLIEEFLKKQ